MCRGVIRLKLQDRLEMPNCVAILLLAGHSLAEAVVRVNVARIKAHGLRKMRDRFVDFSLTRQCHA